ncbi:MAG: hypothetical protein ABSH49_21695 [Bryobacteraceae bacterium]
MRVGIQSSQRRIAAGAASGIAKLDPRIFNYLPLVSPVATLIVVVFGVLFSNRHVDTRVSDLRSEFRSSMSDLRSYIDVRFQAVDARFDAEQRVNEANFKMLIGKVEDIDRGSAGWKSASHADGDKPVYNRIWAMHRRYWQ